MATTYTSLLYHLVFSTRDRLPLITQDVQEPLYQFVGGLVRHQRGALLGAGGMPDHIHLLASLPPSKSLSTYLRHIKSESSRWMNESQVRSFFAWQKGYGAFSVSPSQVPVLLRYIQNQATHHQDRSFQTEFLALLAKHRIQAEEDHLWD